MGSSGAGGNRPTKKARPGKAAGKRGKSVISRSAKKKKARRK